MTCRSLLDIFGLGSSKKNKQETKGKKKATKEDKESENSDTCAQDENGVYSTSEAGHTPKQGQKLRLSSSNFIDLVKMKENVSSKIAEPKSGMLPMRKSGKRTPLMDLVRGGSSSAKVVDSNMLTKEKQKYPEKGNKEVPFNVLNEANIPKIKVNSPQDKKRRKSSSNGEVKGPEESLKSVKSNNKSETNNTSNNRINLARCLITEAQGHTLKQTPQKKKLYSTPGSDGGQRTDRVVSCKYSLRSAGSTPPKPPGPRKKTVSKRNLQDINAKLAESCVPVGSSSDSGSAVRSTSRKPPIQKPPRRSLPKRDISQGAADYANLSSVSLEILAKPRNQPKDNHISATPDPSKRKRDSYKASQQSPIQWSGEISATAAIKERDSQPPKRRRNNSLTESCNSPVMPSNLDKSRHKEMNCEMVTPPSKKRRSVSLSRGRNQSLSRSRSLSSSRLRRNNLPLQQRTSDYVGSTPRIKRRILVTRSRSVASTRPSELSTLKQVRSPLLTPFTAVMKEMEEAKQGKRRKKEKTLADVMKKQLSGVMNTDGGQPKKKATPQKPPRKKLSLKSSKTDAEDVSIVAVKNIGRQLSGGESENGSSSSEDKSQKKPLVPSGKKPPLSKKPSFISDGVTKVRRRFSRPGDVKKIIEALKLQDGVDAQSVNAMNAGHTPKPPRRSRLNSERVIL